MYEPGTACAGNGYIPAPPKSLHTQPSSQPNFEAALDRLREARKELGELTANAAMSRDTIQGPRPEPNDGACRPCRSGLIGAYEDELDSLFETLNELREHLSSIRHGLTN